MGTNKKKQRMSLLLLLLLMFLLLCGYIVLQKQKDVTGSSEDGGDTTLGVEEESSGTNQSVDEEEESTGTILTLDAAEIHQILVKNSKTEMILQYIEETWVLEEDPTLPLKQTYATNMVNALATVTATQTLSEAQEISEYGLEEPQVEIQVSSEEGVIATLLLGDEVPLDGGYYAKRKDQSDIYVVSSSFLGYFSYSLLEMTEVESFPSITADSITYLSVTNKDGTSFEATYDESVVADYAGRTNWTITKAYETPVPGDPDALLTLMGNYTSISYEYNVDTHPEDLTVYGLANPATVIEIGYNEEETDKRITLYIGNQRDDGSYYVTSSETEFVYTMSGNTVDTLRTIDAYSQTDPYIDLITIETVDRISLHTENQSFLMEMERIDDKVTYSFNEVSMEEADFKSLYQSIIGLKTDAQIPFTESHEMEEPAFSIVFEQGDLNQSLSFEFLPYDESYYMVKSNGTMYFLIDQRKIIELVTTIETYQ